MAQRTVALCDGKYIGIETIYTVINGQQINIPEKLEELRNKSRQKKLFCTCGCGANLTLVAGKNMLREQHFRIEPDTGKYECTVLEEGKESVDSKIVLKCWLDDKLKSTDIESRVPINTVEDTKRKPEFTFLSKERHFAIRYWNTSTNINEDRLDVIDANLSGIDVIYIVSAYEGGTKGQYPETMMKIQVKQRYCLLLGINGNEYDKASLRAVFYAKNFDGLWKEISFAQSELKNFLIDGNNDIVLNDKTLDELFDDAMALYTKNLDDEKKHRIEKEHMREAELKRKREEEQKQKEEAENRRKLLLAELEKSQKEYEEKSRQEQEKRETDRIQREEDFKRNMETNFLQQETQVRDANGRRWIKCEYCGKIAQVDNFVIYGGSGHVNLGTCYECNKNNPAVKDSMKELDNNIMNTERKKQYDPTICPECGGKLRERSGIRGRFIGCSNFPNCRYTRNMKE